jgi:aldose 1-epimerase
MNASGDAASVTSRLEFYRQPAWMKQWPFAHTIEVTHRLKDGTLEVSTTVTNMSADPMPSLDRIPSVLPAHGFDARRLDDLSRRETRWTLAANKLPTGETEPIERLFPDPSAARAARVRPR